MNYIINSVFHVQGDTVYFKGEQLPPCPGKSNNITVINDKIYVGGYEWTGTTWKRTARALWHMWF